MLIELFNLTIVEVNLQLFYFDILLLRIIRQKNRFRFKENDKQINKHSKNTWQSYIFNQIYIGSPGDIIKTNILFNKLVWR